MRRGSGGRLAAPGCISQATPNDRLPLLLDIKRAHAVQSHAQHEAAARQALEAHQAAWQAHSAAAAAAAEQRLAAVVGARDALQARLEALAARLLRLAKREARREKQRGVLCGLTHTMYISCQMQGVGLS